MSAGVIAPCPSTHGGNNNALSFHTCVMGCIISYCATSSSLRRLGMFGCVAIGCDVKQGEVQSLLHFEKKFP